MPIKFIAYTAAAEATTAGGKLFKMVIAPVDPDAIPQDIVDQFPDDPEQQLIHAAVDPEELERVIGIYSTFWTAATALQYERYWVKDEPYHAPKAPLILLDEISEPLDVTDADPDLDSSCGE